MFWSALFLKKMDSFEKFVATSYNHLFMYLIFLDGTSLLISQCQFVSVCSHSSMTPMAHLDCGGWYFILVVALIQDLSVIQLD